MSDDALPEPDRLDGALHPRETAALFGQNAAEAQFLAAFNTGRLPHGWLLSGPKGIGKASFAWRAARFLLATPIVQDEGLFGAPPAPASRCSALRVVRDRTWAPKSGPPRRATARC